MENRWRWHSNGIPVRGVPERPADRNRADLLLILTGFLQLQTWWWVKKEIASSEVKKHWWVASLAGCWNGVAKEAVISSVHGVHIFCPLWLLEVVGSPCYILRCLDYYPIEKKWAPGVYIYLFWNSVGGDMYEPDLTETSKQRSYPCQIDHASLKNKTM